MLEDALVYDRTAADVENRTDKGFYRSSDTDRVRSAVGTLANRLFSDGYSFPYVYPTSWAENRIPRSNEADRYINSVRSLRGIIAMPSTYALPETMDGLDWRGANEIERFLDDLDKMIDGYRSSWVYSGEVFSGEVEM